MTWLLASRLALAWDPAGKPLDDVVDVHALPAAGQADRQPVRRAQARVRRERLLRARHVVAVDRLQTVAVLHAEHAEQRLLPDAVQTDADDTPVLLLGDYARLPHQVRLVLEDLVDDAAVDVV